MRIDLDRDLDAASRDDHDPSTLDATTILDGLGRSRRRTGLAWLAEALALALVVGLVAWYRPRLGPAPAPSPTPTPAFTWDRGDPSSTPFSVEEAERRCPTPPGTVVDEALTRRVGGGQVVFVAAPSPGATPSPAPTNPDGSIEPLPIVAACDLGYHRAPDPAPITDAELRGDAATVLRACARRSGFDVDARWHPAPVTLPMEALWGHEGTMAMATTDSGWMLTCHADPSNANIFVEPLQYLLAAGCPPVEVDVRDTDNPLGAGPDAPDVVRTAVVMARGPVPAADGQRVDQDVTSMDITVADPVGTSITGIPVTGGFVAVGRTVTPHRRTTDQQVMDVAITIRLHTRSGAVRTCHA